MPDGFYYEQTDLWGNPPDPYQIQDQADILDLLPADIDSVLDVGCGDGFITNALPDPLRVVGLDISSEALHYVKRPSLAGSILTLPFPDDNFDFVMANDVIEHIPDSQHEQALNELSRVAAKYVLITVPHSEQLEANQAQCVDCGTTYHVHWHQRSYTMDTFRRLCMPSFKLVEIRLSGDVTLPPPDPTISIRHDLGMYRVWDQAVCPNCGSAQQVPFGPNTLIEHVLDAQCCVSWFTNPQLVKEWHGRSEIIALYAKHDHSRPHRAKDYPEIARSRLDVDFSNSLQVATPDFIPGATWAKFAMTTGMVQNDNGIQRSDEQADAVIVPLKLPVKAECGDRIRLSASGQSETDRVALYAVDGVLGRRFLLMETPVLHPNQDIETIIQETWWPDKWGTTLEIHLIGNVVVHELSYTPAESDPLIGSFIFLEPGHHVLQHDDSSDNSKPTLSWGLWVRTPGYHPKPTLKTEMPSAQPPADTVVTLPTALIMAEQAYDLQEQDREALRKLLDDRERAREEAERAYAQTQKDQTALAEQLDATSQQLTQTEQSRANVEQAHATLEHEYQSLSDRLHDTNELLNERETQRDHLEKAYASLQQSYQDLSQQLETVNQKLTQTEEARGKTQVAYSALEKECYAHTQQLVAIRQQLLQTERERDDAQSAYREMGWEHHELGRQMEKLIQQPGDHSPSTLETQAEAGMDQDYATLGRRLEVISQQLAQSETRYGKMEASYTSLLHDYRRLTGHLKEQQEHLETLHAAHDSLRESYQNLHQKLEQTDKNRDAAEQAYTTLQLEYNSVADQLSQRRGIKGGLKEVARTIKHKLIGPPICVPQPVFPEPWKPFDPNTQPSDARPKVLIISHMFPHPDQPSSGPFIHEQIQALRQYANIDARVLVGRPFWMTHKNPLRLLDAERCYRRFHDACQWLDLEGVPVLYLPYRIFGPFATHGWAYRNSVLRAIKRVRAQFPFELIHAHTSYLDGSAGLAVSKRFNMPLIITAHTGPFSYLMSKTNVRRVTLNALKGATRVVAVSQSQKRDVAEHLDAKHHAKFTVLPNMVNTDLFRPSTSPSSGTGILRILFVGYFVPVKNLTLLLEAFATVRCELPHARLRLVGGGETENQQQELAQTIKRMGLDNDVTIDGYRTRDAIARIIREECDMLVLCSKSETFGCVLTEAMACGKPVVATRCGGPEDVVTQDFLGELCPNNDLQALAKAILRVASRLETYVPDDIRRHAQTYFSCQSVARKIANLYREVGCE